MRKRWRSLALSCCFLCVLCAVALPLSSLPAPFASAAPQPAVADLLSRLDPDRPGLEAVRDAVRRHDERRAERELLDYFRQRQAPRWFPEPPATPGSRQRVSGRAQAVLNHDFTFQSRRTRLGARIDWHANPVGDREWTWALNRHGYFDDLVAAYRLTDDERYARELDALIADWVRANPVPDHPDNLSDAWSEREAGSRMSGPWLRVWDALRDSPSFRPETRLAMLRSFMEHADYLSRVPGSGDRPVTSSPRSAGAPGGIPALQAANGLAHVGVFFPEFKDAGAWRRAAVERLEAEMQRQVLPDGGQIELSTLFQQDALQNFAQPLRLLALDPELRFSDAYLDGITRLQRWNLDLARPDHTLPQLNDADRVTVERLPSVIEALSGVASPRLQAALARWRSLDFAVTSLALPDSGLYVMRGGSGPSPSLCLAIDAGPFGAAHQHEDKLGLDLYAFGRSLLVDPGRYSETDEGAWFRGPLAHNTVLVDGLGQNRRATPPGRWVANGGSPDTRWSVSAGMDFFEGVYDEGYGPSSSRAVKHVRQVLFVKPFYWVVWDRLAPDQGPVRARRFDQLWHFAPGRATVDQERRMVTTAEADRANLAVLPVSPEATLRVVEGGESTARADLLQGWYSPEYGLREPAPVAVYTCEAVPPVLFETVLFPYAAGPRPAFEAERLPVTSGGEAAAPPAVSAFRFRFGRFTDLILMTHDPQHAARLKEAGDLRTDAETLLLRLDSTDRPVRLLARAVSSVVYVGRSLFASEKPRDAVDLDLEK